MPPMPSIRTWPHRKPCLCRHGTFSGPKSARAWRVTGLRWRSRSSSSARSWHDRTRGFRKCATRRRSVSKTLAGVMIGTPYYLSPEQALGDTAYERSDLYSLGVRLCELLTGHRTHAAASLLALFEMHNNAPIPKLPENVARPSVSSNAWCRRRLMSAIEALQRRWKRSWDTRCPI
jgi:serine/threonine protein kinase